MAKSEKYPWMQFFYADWLSDSKLAMCHPATRGIWFDMLCIMHGDDRSGLITGTLEQMSRACRCTAVELENAVQELKSTGAAEVTERNGFVTVVNRRMRKDYKDRKVNRERVLRSRRKISNGDVMEKKRSCNGDVMVHKSEVRSHIDNNSSNNAGERLPDFEKIKSLWNSFATEKQKIGHIENFTHNLMSMIDELGYDGVIKTIENYRQARAMPETKSHEHVFGRFTAKNYLPYRPGHYDPAAYQWKSKQKEKYENATNQRNFSGQPVDCGISIEV